MMPIILMIYVVCFTGITNTLTTEIAFYDFFVQLSGLWGDGRKVKSRFQLLFVHNKHKTRKRKKKMMELNYSTRLCRCWISSLHEHKYIVCAILTTGQEVNN